MAKLIEPKGEGFGKSTKTRRPSSKIMGGANINEGPGEINTKHFGHVVKTAKALHGSDPYCASHKL